MSQNPFLNALGAISYIAVVVSLLHVVSNTLGDTPDTAFAPVAFLSLLTLSAAIMAYLFFYSPLLLLLEGKKREAVRLFTQTIALFGTCTGVVWVLLLMRVI